MTYFKTLSLIALSLLTAQVPSYAQASGGSPKKAIHKAVQSSCPSGYQQLGTTELFYRQTSSSVDFIGRFNSQYYSSTFSNGGYRLAIQVGSNSPTNVDCQYGTTVGDVTCSVGVVQQGELGRVVYTVTNSSTEDVIVSLGTHADVMIGNNDSAPISRKIDTIGNTYGVAMRDGNGAQLCVLFGAGLVGVNAVSDYWFGYYYLNIDYYNMVGNYSSGNNYMEENGSYDSGMGWCWKNRTVPANSSVEFSYLIGVGEVNLEPNSSFEVTPDDPEGWNDLSRPHLLTLQGEYESPAGQNGRIEYAVEDSEEWLALTDELESGSTFTAELTAMFNPELPVHTIRFRTVDAVGNTSLLSPITYKDVSFHQLEGIENKPYNWGEPVEQTDAFCDLAADQYVLTGYRNNVNIGTATFNMEGLFPYTIGRRAYNFEIEPRPLECYIDFDSGTYDYVYNHGYSIRPSWHFCDDLHAALVEYEDYRVEWVNNVYPGTALLKVVGIGNFSGTLQLEFSIEKCPASTDYFYTRLPGSEITYDGNPHAATGEAHWAYRDGFGEIKFYYAPTGLDEMTEEAPIEAGTYDVYFEVMEGTCYTGYPLTFLGTFTIYDFDDNDWAVILALAEKLNQAGLSPAWDLTDGKKCAPSLAGLTIEQGKVTKISLSGRGLSGTIPEELFMFENVTEIDLRYNSFSGKIEDLDVVNETVRKIVIAYNSLEGNLGAFVANFPNLRQIEADNNSLTEIDPAIPSSVQTTYYSQKFYTDCLELSLADIMDCATFINSLPQIARYRDSGKVTLALQHVSDGKVSSVTLTLADKDAKSGGGSAEVWAESGEVWTANISDVYHTDVRLFFDKADADFDGKVDILDLQTTVNYIFGQMPSYWYFNIAAADLWKDSNINVQDVVLMVDEILYAPIEETTARNNVKDNRTYDNNVYTSGRSLIVDCDTPVAALDILLSGNEGFTLSDELIAAGFSCSIREMENAQRVVIYNLSGTTIPEGLSAIGSCGNAEVLAVTLSDENAGKIEAGTAKPMSALDAKVTDYDVTLRDGRLTLTSPVDLSGFCWQLFTADGRLVAGGECDIVAGENLLKDNLGINGIVMFVATGSNLNIVKKISK